MGNFYGVVSGGSVVPDTPYYNLFVPINVTQTRLDEIELLHTDYHIPSELTIYGDSIEGTFSFPDSVYQFQPYLLGTWRKEKGVYFIEGTFVAWRTNGYKVRGPFIIEYMD